MQELPEELVRAIWMKLGEQSEEEVLGDLQKMQEEQGPVMAVLLNEPKDVSEYAREIVLHLGLTLFQAVAWRKLPKGPLKLPSIQEERLQRNLKKRRETVGTYLQGKAARALDFDEALESLGEQAEFPQWALVGHLAEAFLDEEEADELDRAEAEAGLVVLLAILDALDQVVKS